MSQKQNKKIWLLVLIGYFILNFVSFIATRVIVKTELSLRITFNIMVLSLVIAIIPSIAIYFERKVFILLYTCSNLIALAYMLSIVLSDAVQGWGDLTSILGYLFFMIIGFIIALISDIISVIYKRFKNKS